MSSIDGISNTATGSVILRGIQSRPDPAEKSQNLAYNTSGDLDKTELSEMGKELSKITDKDLDADASITPVNADEDPTLNQEKTENMTQETIGQAPQKTGGTNAHQISRTYLANSGEDQLSRLQQLLSNLAEDLKFSDDTTPTA